MNEKVAEERAPVALRAVISAIPFVVVVVAVYCMGRGLFLFLKGDETFAPVLWAFVAPVLAAPVGLGIQILLVKFVSRRFSAEEFDSPDDSSFL